ncbi:unnamed protein product [Ixodes hexagonus]
MAARIRFCAVAVISLCAVLVEQGASMPQKCESAKFADCIKDTFSRLNPIGDTSTRESLNKDCATVDTVFVCTKHAVIDGCKKEIKSYLELLEDGARAIKNSICDDNLYESMVEWNRCFNRTIDESCEAAYKDELEDLAHKNQLPRDEERCRYGRYSCVLRAAEGCPSQSLAREVVKNSFNTFHDLRDCPRLDGSSGLHRCDAARFTRCFSNALMKMKISGNHRDITAELLAEDCALARSVDSCTKYMVIEGCPDEYKQQLEDLKSDFDSVRSYVCDGNLHESIAEWGQCLDRGMLKSCMDKTPYENCSHFNCLVNATAKCPSQSLVMKATHHWLNTYRDLNNCLRIDWSSGVAPSPAILLTFAALCISLYPLRKQISHSQLG